MLRIPQLRVSQRMYGYDVESGLAFTEVHTTPFSMNDEWVWDGYRPLGDDSEDYEERQGARSLSSTCIQYITNNMRDLPAEVLKEVPWTVSRDIWKELQERYDNPFGIWKIFATAYGGVELDANRYIGHYEQMIPRQRTEVESYARHIKPPALEWLTHLTLNKVTCTKRDFIQLGELQNLNALTIGLITMIPTTDVLDDSVIRGMSRASLEINGFRVLRTLVFQRQRWLSDRIFEYARDFQSLTCIILTQGVNLTFNARVHPTYGWQKTTIEELWDLFKMPRSHDDWAKLFRWCNDYGTIIRAGNLSAEEIKSIENAPTLDFYIGLTQLSTQPTTGNTYHTYLSSLPSSSQFMAYLRPAKGFPQAAASVKRTHEKPKEGPRKLRKAPEGNALAEFGI